MKASFAFISLVASAAAYTPFTVSGLYTSQPTGNPDGQENYYHIWFTVNSTNGVSTQSGYCNAFWGDNSQFASPQEAYSTVVPTGSYKKCDSSSANLGDGNSEFSFQLFPYFSIGNFSVEVQQTFTQSIKGVTSQEIASGEIHVTNTTAQYTCQINPQEVPDASVHASGSCSIPAGEPNYTIPITSSGSACTSTNSSVAFPVTETTTWGEAVLVVGNITELGNWAPSDAIALNANQYTSSDNLWDGTVSIPAGTAFQYKYILENTDGSITWECCENRVYTVPSSSCGAVTAGNNPDTFRN